LLSESEIKDETLIEIACVINYEPNLLRLMLGRSIPTAQENEDTSGKSVRHRTYLLASVLRAAPAP